MYRSARIIDANLNRLTEALKVAEDLCRFDLEDLKLVREVRSLRKELDRVIIPMRRKVVPHRGSRTDLGRSVDFDRTGRREPEDVLPTNLKRAQEACRILEEVAKVDFPDAVGAFKTARFRCYDLEQAIVNRLARQFDPRLYVVLDTATVGRERFAEIAGELARAKIGMVQLREPKDVPTRTFLADARRVQGALAGTQPKLIINDRVDVALAVQADGVHLGQDDMPLKTARKLLPGNMIVGVSVRTPKEARMGERGGADYLGAGAVFPTPSKPDARVIGLSGLRAICRSTRLPVVAIGGITIGNARRVRDAGVDGIAVISAVFGGGKLRDNLKLLDAETQ